MSLMRGGGARVHNGVIKEIVVGFMITTPRARGVGKKTRDFAGPREKSVKCVVKSAIGNIPTSMLPRINVVLFRSNPM